MVAWWILVLAGAVCFLVGWALSARFFLSNFKKNLMAPDSDMRKMLDSHIDSMDSKWWEMAASMAELYQANFPCPNKCGSKIAQGLRESTQEAPSIEL